MLPADGWYLPTSQSLHDAAYASANCPASQAVQLAAFSVAEYLPTSHASHNPESSPPYMPTCLNVPAGHAGVGDAVGDAVGFAVGDAVGASVGSAVGSAVGLALGAAVGNAVGSAVGSAVGLAVGAAVGSAVGSAVGFAVGFAVGSVVGVAVGLAVGTAVGIDTHVLRPLRPAVHVPSAQS